jgi:predicted DNA repair protein MutK
MSTTLLYALIMAVGQIVLTLVGYFLGYQTDKINQGSWFAFVPLVYAIVVYWLAIKAVREEDAGKYLTFGKGVGTGVMIAVYSGLLGTIYAYIHFNFVNPSFADYLIEASRVKWVAANMSDAQMEAAEKFMRLLFKPVIQAVFGFILTVVTGLIISLIMAAILKRNPPDEDAAAA